MRENFPVCEISCIHTDDVDTVREKMPEDEVLYELADLFKVFSDSTRIKILWALSVSELCVCDIAHLLDMTQSAISHHLRTLKLSRLVKSRKSGKIVYYSLDDSHVYDIFAEGLAHVGHTMFNQKGEKS